MGKYFLDEVWADLYVKYIQYSQGVRYSQQIFQIIYENYVSSLDKSPVLDQTRSD